MGFTFQAGDCGHNIDSAVETCILEDEWTDQRRVFVNPNFKKQTRGLRLFRWQEGWVLFSHLCRAENFKEVIWTRHHRYSDTQPSTATSNGLHLHAHFDWLERAKQKHTDGPCFMSCQKKGFGEIKEKWEKVIVSQWEVRRAVPVQQRSPQRKTSCLDLYISEITHMSRLTKRIVRSKSLLHAQRYWLTDWQVNDPTNHSCLVPRTKNKNKILKYIWSNFNKKHKQEH